ncbi:MAG: lipopolysaccharide/colanic/teichoic acid biosynthesis glycosyltransferase [Granulosicoccus sp.]
MSNLGRKRIFDLVVITLWAVVWVPVVAVFAILVLFIEGRPVFYPSSRRVSMEHIKTIYKFRTMIRDADKTYNRGTVPVSDFLFLNTPLSSPLYTKIGRIIEKYTITELPQFVNVLMGTMSIVGNRPLPENVVELLDQEFPGSRLRFQTLSGMTGPVQLVGRSDIIDRDRLVLEIMYCQAVEEAYTWRLDFLVLLFTVLIALRITKPKSVEETKRFITKHTGFHCEYPDSFCRRNSPENGSRVVWSKEAREFQAKTNSISITNKLD